MTVPAARSIVRAVAVDFDGTLTRDGHLSRSGAQAVQEARRAGLRVVLVTGRILDELLEVAPDVTDRFDLIVGENGAVALYKDHLLPLADPIDDSFVQELVGLGTGVRRGRVIAALPASYHAIVAATLQQRALDCQLITNRSELMILPAGVSKATGLEYALEALGRSPHTTLAIGDAENDLAMLLSCEIGAAVGDSVEVLRAHADLTATDTDGDGVAEILRGPVVKGTRRVHPPRWHIPIGTDRDGKTVTLPTSQVNVLVTGPSGSGKSYIAGMLAERLLELGYDMLIVDPEGDYATLGQLPKVLTLGEQAIPEPADVIAYLRRWGSLVLDLSTHTPSERDQFMNRLAPQLAALRDESGRPDWVLIDEAHYPYGQNAASSHFYRDLLSGHLVVTYAPEQLGARVLESIDITLTVSDDRSTVLVTRTDQQTPEIDVTVAHRRLGHLRHHHKYSTWGVPPERGFWFREGPGPANGAVAHNLDELRRGLSGCSDVAVRHHAADHEFSRWVDQVFGDHALASEIAVVESRVQRATDSIQLREASRQLSAIIAENLRQAEFSPP